MACTELIVPELKFGNIFKIWIETSGNKSRGFLFYDLINLSTKSLKTMGKGDIKTRKGKITNGSFGVTRPRSNRKAEIQTKVSKKSKKTTAKKTEVKK